jgi:hypothetical protein
VSRIPVLTGKGKSEEMPRVRIAAVALTAVVLGAAGIVHAQFFGEGVVAIPPPYPTT